VTVIVRTALAELNQAAHAVTNPDIPMPPPARTGGDTALPMRDVVRLASDGIHYLAVFRQPQRTPDLPGPPNPHRHRRSAHHLLRPRRRLYAPRLFSTGLPLRGAPQPGLVTGWQDGRRLPVLRVPTRPQSRERGPLSDRSHRHRPAGLDRRHPTTRGQPRPSPRRTPARRHRPTRQR